MKRIIVCLVISCLTQYDLKAQVNNMAPGIIPAVQQWKATQGTFVINQKTKFRYKSDATIKRTIQIFWEDLADLHAGHEFVATKRNSNRNYITITIEPEQNLSETQKESYTLDIKPESILIKAMDAKGVFYATRTLLQLIEQTADKRTIPCYAISDSPSYPFRGFMLDVGRKFFPISQLKDYIRRMSWYKMNQLQLHLNDQAFHGEHYAAFRIQSKTFPELTSKDGFYTKEQIKELIQFAKDRDVNIIPEIDAPAHALSILDVFPELKNDKLQDGQLDVLNPKTTVVMEKIFDEFVPLFPSPYFHIGTDEYRFKKSATKEERKAFAAGFCNYINHFNRYIRKKGKQVMIWSGYNHMAGFTPIDTNIIIDMWIGKDAKQQIAAGHQIVQSTDGWLYIVPGANYYGVNNRFLYKKWQPNDFGGDQKIPLNNPNLLGAKLHVWNDLGPMGFTYHETSEEIEVSMPVIAEKLWGNKSSPTFTDFVKRINEVKVIPHVNDYRVLENLKNEDAVIDVDFDKSNFADAVKKQLVKSQTGNEKNHVLNVKAHDFVSLNLKADQLEQPWTLSFKVKELNNPDTPAVLFESPYGSIFMNLKDKKTGKSGIGIGRAVGNKQYPGKGNDFYYEVFNTSVPLNEWTQVAFTGGYRGTTLYINGNKIGTIGKQFVCPLKTIGSNNGQISAEVLLDDIKVFSRILNEEEIKALQ
jgi:hexosaminidase